MRDSDFQEKMFAKQMAIIKGQAWNVVETLKSPDHGPLELTRRGRVCVWDDLVEVPVAVPMHTQSSETRRKPAAVHYDDSNEMDIAAAGTSSNGQPHMSTILTNNKDQPDLLGFASPDQERPNPFNTSRQSSHLDMRTATTTDVPERTLSPPNMLALSASVHSEPSVVPTSPRRPGQTAKGARMSFDESRRQHHQRGRKQRHVRQLSHSARLVGGGGGEEFAEDDEGDLGFAVAEGRDAIRRKVIVERLENVKTKNPVFECC
jgi:phosphatidylinositol 4-kinase type 2